MSQQEKGFNPDHERSERTQRLLELIGELRLPATPEMESLANSITSENAVEVIRQWRPLAEKVAEQSTGEEWQKAQVGLLIEEAKLMLKAGMMEEFFEAAEDAALYASQMGYIKDSAD